MGEAVVLGSLSIFDRVFLGLDEAGEPVNVVLAERNLLVGGEPGAGKSVALNLIVAHAALSLDCRLVLVDGKRVELGVWRKCADTFVGPSIGQAIGVLRDLQAEMDTRYERLLATGRRKIAPGDGVPVILGVFDEVAYFSATVGEPKQQKESPRCCATSSPGAGPPASSSSPQRSGRRPTSSRPRCGTCSATGGPSAAPPKPRPM